MRFIFFIFSIITGVSALFSIIDIAIINYDNLYSLSILFLIIIFLLFLIYVYSSFGFINKDKSLLRAFFASSIAISIGYGGNDFTFKYISPLSLDLTFKHETYIEEDYIIDTKNELYSLVPTLVLSRADFNINNQFLYNFFISFNILILISSFYASFILKKSINIAEKDRC